MRITLTLLEFAITVNCDWASRSWIIYTYFSFYFWVVSFISTSPGFFFSGCCFATELINCFRMAKNTSELDSFVFKALLSDLVRSEYWKSKSSRSSPNRLPCCKGLVSLGRGLISGESSIICMEGYLFCLACLWRVAVKLGRFRPPRGRGGSCTPRIGPALSTPWIVSDFRGYILCLTLFVSETTTGIFTSVAVPSE